jgi:monoamine oxidase
MSTSIIIIGAGASGLMAARSLSAAGWSVTVLEAADAPGGRILTLAPAGFSTYVEGGAEFIHGDLPISLQLGKEAGIVLHPVHSQMARPRIEGEPGTGLENEGWDDFMTSDWDELMQKMQQLGQDQPLGDFLATFFPGERYAALRDRARRYAEGYDLADLHSASCRGLYKEWANDQEEEEEYRPEGGYRRMVDHLVEECRRYDCTLHFSSPVAEVHWQPGRVEVKTVSGQPFTADRLLITVSLGVLQQAAGAGSRGSSGHKPHAPLRFFPAIPDYLQAACEIGYGHIVKILLEFKTAFWREKGAQDQTLFILSDQPVPTWWTQTASTDTLLTGWLPVSGIPAFLQLDRQGRIDRCLDSLAAIFAVDRAALSSQLTAALVLDWSDAPYILGGYSFPTVGSQAARALLSTPVEGTLWFSGEGLYEGDTPGTVEAAFSNGLETAKKIIAQL